MTALPTNRDWLEGSTALKTAMVWRAGQDLREAAEGRRRFTLVGPAMDSNGRTFVATPDGACYMEGGRLITITAEKAAAFVGSVKTYDDGYISITDYPGDSHGTL